MTTMYFLPLGLLCLAGLLLLVWRRRRRRTRVSRAVRELDEKALGRQPEEPVSVPMCNYSAESNPSAFLIRSGPPPRS